jgi:hypothetical protein
MGIAPASSTALSSMPLGLTESRGLARPVQRHGRHGWRLYVRLEVHKTGLAQGGWLALCAQHAGSRAGMMVPSGSITI